MNRTNRRLLGIIAAEILALVALGFVAVTVIRATSREEPITVIDSPASNSEYHAGEEVAIQSTSTDPTGVARVKLVVDGTVIRTDVPPQPQVTFTVIQTWIATEGVHGIAVRAFNQGNEAGNLAEIVVTVLPAATSTAISTPRPTPTATSTSTPSPTLTPMPTQTPSPACTDKSAFVVDVAVPDGTVLAPGQAFNKIWRVLNSGTCAWGNGYTFTFVGGDLMGASSVIAVPNASLTKQLCGARDLVTLNHSPNAQPAC